MIKYSLRYKGDDITISLNSQSSNEKKPILIAAKPNIASDCIDWLSGLTGAFGHLLGENTTPIDLDAALKMQTHYKYKIIEGAELVTKYDSQITTKEVQT